MKIVPYEPGLLGSYLAFAARSWGPSSYQASPQYLQWMYDANPLARPDRKDLVLAVRDGDVIGCLHKMRINWRHGSDVIELPTSHNWMVSETDRKGLGTMLLMAGLRERHVFVPSAAGPLADIFRALKAEEIRPSRTNWILRPLQAAARVGVAKALGPQYVPHAHRRGVLDRAPARSYGAIRFDPAPSHPLQAALLDRWIQSRPPRSGPAWDEQTFRWRFFDPHGPRHVAVYSGTTSVDGFLLFSVSLRRSVLVAHLQEGSFRDARELHELFRVARRALRSLRVHIIVVFSGDPRLDEYLANERLAIRSDAASAFVVHSNRKHTFGDISVMASACDLGFESITTWS